MNNKSKSGNILAYFSLAGILINIVLVGILSLIWYFSSYDTAIVFGFFFMIYFMILPFILFACLALGIISYIMSHTNSSICAMTLSIVQILVYMGIYFLYLR